MGWSHDTVAKLLKGHAINLSQIDPTNAADLIFRAAAARYSTSECQIQNFTAIIIGERDADGRAGGILTLRAASYGREQGISIASSSPAGMRRWFAIAGANLPGAFAEVTLKDI